MLNFNDRNNSEQSKQFFSMKTSVDNSSEDTSDRMRDLNESMNRFLEDNAAIGDRPHTITFQQVLSFSEGQTGFLLIKW
jgi:hypothetical protein